MPENERFTALANDRKHIADTIKMIAYRAETATANIIKPYMAKPDEARTLLKQVFRMEADIKPDIKNGLIVVSLHNLSANKYDKIIRKLCDFLNKTETVFPGTNPGLFYNLVSDYNP